MLLGCAGKAKPACNPQRSEASSPRNVKPQSKMKPSESKVPEGFEKVTEGNVKKGDHATVMFGDEQIGGDASGLAGAPVVPLRIMGVTVYRKKAESEPAKAPAEQVGSPNDGAPSPKAKDEPKKPETTKADRPRMGVDDENPLVAKVPMGLIMAVAMAQDAVAKLNGRDHTFRKENKVSEQLSEAIGHLYAFMDGEDHEIRTNVHHLGHAAMRIGYVLQNLSDGTLVDDRTKHAPES